MATGVYLLCALTSALCAVLLLRGFASEAVDMAQGAFQRAKGQAAPRVLAFTKLIEARAHAREQDARAASRALAASEEFLARANPESGREPVWIDFYHHARLSVRILAWPVDVPECERCVIEVLDRAVVAQIVERLAVNAARVQVLRIGAEGERTLPQVVELFVHSVTPLRAAAPRAQLALGECCDGGGQPLGVMADLAGGVLRDERDADRLNAQSGQGRELEAPCDDRRRGAPPRASGAPGRDRSGVF
jgi:hypothetical protein